jgi:hypothetical protein
VKVDRAYTEEGFLSQKETSCELEAQRTKQKENEKDEEEEED